MEEIKRYIDKVEIDKDTTNFIYEIEALYLEYLKNLKTLKKHDERKFLRTYQREELKQTNELESVSSLISAFYSDYRENKDLERIITHLRFGHQLDTESLNKIHRLIMEHETREHIKVGGFRDIPIQVGKYVDGERKVAFNAPEPDEIPGLMNEILEYYHDNTNPEDIKNHPFVKPAIIHAVTTAVQPYQDGNKRISRIMHHLKLWELTKKKYNVKLHLPAFYFSGSYVFAKNGYTSKVYGLKINNFETESWESWIRYNLLIMYEQLPILIDNINHIEQKEKGLK